jgi:hypothetical protein
MVDLPNEQISSMPILSTVGYASCLNLLNNVDEIKASQQILEALPDTYLPDVSMLLHMP